MSSQSEELVQVKDLWFTDHNLVLQAGHRVFRVSGGILAARSSVFRDMLAMPHPEDEPTMDGCPIVVLYDSPIDVEHFLRALFDSSYFERPPAPTSFSTIASILRLGTKYDVEFLRHRALLHVAASSPTSLKAYDALDTTTSLHPSITFPLLRVAEEFNLRWAMPAALYAISCLNIEEILDGVPDDTGNTIRLSPALQRVCLISHTQIANFQVHRTLRFFHTPRVEGCKSEAQCRERRHTFFDEFSKGLRLEPLDFLHPNSWTNSMRKVFCATCLGAGQADYRKAREELWERLPEMFGLPAWRELDLEKTSHVDE